ncbi:hypothetical protein ACFQ2M_41830 [Kitasatospora saccharophila]
MQACRRLDPPAIVPDAKAVAAAQKAAAKQAQKPSGPRRTRSTTTIGADR